MRIVFADKKLAALYTREKGAEKYGERLVDSFFVVLAAVASAASPQDLRRLKQLHYEKLKGREPERSLRLHRGWRLIIVEAADERGAYIEVRGIEDYH